MKKRVRAIIVQNRSILLMHRIKQDREYWVFPGGGLEETDLSPEEGLKRECFEELGVKVEVGNFFTEEEYGPSEERQVELFYCCEIINGVVGLGKGPEFTRDSKQFGVYDPQWVPISDLTNKNVQPTPVRDKVIAAGW